MKDKWRNYAFEDGKIKSCYIREHRNRKTLRSAREAVDCHSNVQSGQEQPKIQEKIGIENESERKKDSLETHQEGRQGIQISDQGRCEAEETNHELKIRQEEVKDETSNRCKRQTRKRKNSESST
jgi:hypothetical protein